MKPVLPRAPLSSKRLPSGLPSDPPVVPQPPGNHDVAWLTPDVAPPQRLTVDLNSCQTGANLVTAVFSRPMSASQGGIQPKAFARKATSLDQPSPVLPPLNTVVCVAEAPPVPVPRAATPKKATVYLPVVERLRPRVSKDIFGNPKALQAFTAWVKARRRNPRVSASPETPVIAVLYGPPGVGKTTAAHVVLKEHGYGIVECNASDSRTRDVIYSRIVNTATRRSLDRLPQALVLDEIDGSVNDVGDDPTNTGVQGVLRFLEECRSGKWTMVHPIVCICNDVAHPDVRRLLAETLAVRFWPPFPKVMHQALTKLSQCEGVRLNVRQAERLVSAAHGDLRKLGQLLQMYAAQIHSGVEAFAQMSSNDDVDNIFDATRKVLYQRIPPEQARRLSACDPGMMLLMLEENVAALASLDPQTGATREGRQQDCVPLAQMLEDLSTADVFHAAAYSGRFSGGDGGGGRGKRGHEVADDTSLQLSECPNGMDAVALSVRIYGEPFRRRVHDAREDSAVRFTQFFERDAVRRQTRQAQGLAAWALEVPATDAALAAWIWRHQKPDEQLPLGQRLVTKWSAAAGDRWDCTHPERAAQRGVEPWNALRSTQVFVQAIDAVLAPPSSHSNTKRALTKPRHPTPQKRTKQSVN